MKQTTEATPRGFGSNAGRRAGTPNKTPRERIRENRERFERELFDKAMAGDTLAQKACIDIIDAEPQVITSDAAKPPRKKATGT